MAKNQLTRAAGSVSPPANASSPLADGGARVRIVPGINWLAFFVIWGAVYLILCGAVWLGMAVV